MTKEEYFQKIDDAVEDFKRIKNKLSIEYAKANNPHKEGDIVEAFGIKIRIEKIGFTMGLSTRIPGCIYYGPRLKKNNEPFKSGERDTVYQSNIRKNENNNAN
jgi:hypothetical protein